VFIYNDPRRRARTNDQPIPAPTPKSTSATISATGEPLRDCDFEAAATRERSTTALLCVVLVVVAWGSGFAFVDRLCADFFCGAVLPIVVPPERLLPAGLVDPPPVGGS
jgi:hypothetical protein